MGNLTIVFPSFNVSSLVNLLGISKVAIGFAIQDIQTRATTINTYDGRRVVTPNTELFTEAVAVNTAYDGWRCEYDIGVGYGDGLDRAKRILLEAVRSVDGVINDPPAEVFVVGITDPSINVRLWWWVQPPTQRNVPLVQDRVLIAAQKAVTENGIDFPMRPGRSCSTTNGGDRRGPLGPALTLAPAVARRHCARIGAALGKRDTGHSGVSLLWRAKQDSNTDLS